jgi:uncharacterized membrane protein YgcG
LENIIGALEIERMIMALHIKDNDFNGGIIAGITAIITAINANDQFIVFSSYFVSTS